MKDTTPATQNQVSAVYKGNEAHLLALRKSDPVASLRERIEALRKRLSPDRFVTDFGYTGSLLPKGWAVVAIPEDSVIYTIGLHYHFGQPELLISSKPLAIEELTRLLNDIGRRVEGGLRLKVGDPVQAGGSPWKLEAYLDEDFDTAPCGYLATFEEMFEDRFHVRGGTLPVLKATGVPTKQPA